MATLQSGKCFTVPTFFGMCCRSEWQERMYIYKWHEVDQTKHEIFCVHIVISQSKFRNHYFLFLFAFYILSQFFLIWGCTSKYKTNIFEPHAGQLLIISLTWLLHIQQMTNQLTGSCYSLFSHTACSSQGLYSTLNKLTSFTSLADSGLICWRNIPHSFDSDENSL